MRPKFDRRFWILLCWHIALQCLLCNYHLFRIVSGESVGVGVVKHRDPKADTQLTNDDDDDVFANERRHGNDHLHLNHEHASHLHQQLLGVTSNPSIAASATATTTITTTIQEENDDISSAIESPLIYEPPNSPTSPNSPQLTLMKNSSEVQLPRNNGEGSGSGGIRNVDTFNSIMRQRRSAGSMLFNYKNYTNLNNKNINNNYKYSSNNKDNNKNSGSSSSSSNVSSSKSHRDALETDSSNNNPLTSSALLMATTLLSARNSAAMLQRHTSSSSLSSSSSSEEQMGGDSGERDSVADDKHVNPNVTNISSLDKLNNRNNRLTENSDGYHEEVDDVIGVSGDGGGGVSARASQHVPPAAAHATSAAATRPSDYITRRKNVTSTHDAVREQHNFDVKISDSDEQIIILGADDVVSVDDDVVDVDASVDHINGDDAVYMSDEPKVLPLRPIIRGPFDDDEDHQGDLAVVYAEQHTEVKLNCDVDLDLTSAVWLKDGQMVHTTDRNAARPTDIRFIKETRGALTITNVMLEDDGKWQCEAENARGYVENARQVKLVVLDRPKQPYLLIDSRRLDAGNIFVPVKENSELNLACVTEGGNPKPLLTWEVLLSPGVDRHSQKVAAEVLELQEVKNEKDTKDDYKIGSGAKSEARLPAVYRAHHNARILCVMEHPTLKMRQNASLLLDVQYTPSFAISRTPGFGYPLREGIEVSLKCDVDSNPPSTPVWQKDDGEPPVTQTGDGFLNFTSVRREHSGWYKCTSRHLNFQYSSIGYFLSVRYDSVDVTSEPIEQEMSMAASHNPNKSPQLEVQLGGAVTLQCPQGSLGCWSHLDPVSARLKGLGIGSQMPTGQFSLKDVVYQDAGTYKCIGQNPTNKKKLEVLQTVGVQVKGHPTVTARNATPVAYPGSPLHLSVEFCANPPAFAARWLHGDRVYTPGNQYGIDVLAYGVIDLPTPFCKEARLTYVHMHERVPRTFYFIVSSPGGVAEAIFHVNFTFKHKVMSNSIDDDEEELSEPEEIHFPVFGSTAVQQHASCILSLTMAVVFFVCMQVSIFL